MIENKVLKLNELIEKIKEADYAYYMNSNPTMSDREYDTLRDELTALENELGIIYSNSPTQTVSGNIVDYLNKVEHPTKMLSLDKTKDKSKLKSWLGQRLGVLSLKIDGITVVLHYSDGHLVQAVTRGNGKIGEDITHNVKMFANVPLVIPYNDDLIVRGEAFIDYKTFEKINSKLEQDKQYKNPRNLCSGTLRQLDNNNIKDRNVQFYLFDVITEDVIQSDSKSDLFDYMGKKLGFAIVPYSTIADEDFDITFDRMKEFVESCNIPSDGLVLTYDSITYGESLGETSHHPRHSLAFKWKDELVETTLLDIEWQTSRTGILTPVAIFESVDIEGTTIERASVHNLSIVKELELGIGDIIQVYKANMIIPQIEENLTRSNGIADYFIPQVCPSCEEPVVIETSDTGVETIMCHNKNCPAQIMFKLKHFCSRDAMNIKGLTIVWPSPIFTFLPKGL